MPISFDLTWARNGFGSVHEKTDRAETFGPITVKFKGEFDSLTALVNGSWTDHPALDLPGNLVDSKSNTNVREITVEATP